MFLLPFQIQLAHKISMRFLLFFRLIIQLYNDYSTLQSLKPSIIWHTWENRIEKLRDEKNYKVKGKLMIFSINICKYENIWKQPMLNKKYNI